MRIIHKSLYTFSLATWIANWLLCIINLLVDITAISFVVLFLSVVLQSCLSGNFCEGKYKAQKSNQKDLLDIAILLSGIVAKVGMAVGFVSLLISGGDPAIVDGSYCVVNHGDIVRSISQKFYLYLSICEYLLMSCGLLVFTTYAFSRIRNIYLLQNQAFNCKYL